MYNILCVAYILLLLLVLPAFISETSLLFYMMSRSGCRQCRQEGYRGISQRKLPCQKRKRKRYNYGHESGVRSIIELRKEDLSAIESVHLSQKGSKGKRGQVDAPLLDLYSMMVDCGRCNTARILSLS